MLRVYNSSMLLFWPFIIKTFHLKHCMDKVDSDLKSTGRSVWAGVWSENKPHLLNKLNYIPWDVRLAGVQIFQCLL